MVRACISWINFHEPLSEFNRKNVSRSYQTGVPNGAARQNTRSSYRIWASWEKLHWLISWLENLNERLASWKYGIFMPFSGWIKRYIFSPGNRTVFFFMDIRVSEASKCAWKSPHASCRNDTFCQYRRKFVWVRQQNVLLWSHVVRKWHGWVKHRSPFCFSSFRCRSFMENTFLCSTFNMSV